MRILAGSIALVAAQGCNHDSRIASGKEIRATLSELRRSRADSPLSIQEIVPGDWSRLYVFAPYTPASVISKCLGGADKPPATEGIESRDDITLLVMRFADGSRVSRAVPRGDPDFVPHTVGAAYAPAAEFGVRREPNHDWSVLVPTAEPIQQCLPAPAARRFPKTR